MRAAQTDEVDYRELSVELLSALRFVLAFFEPGQRYLDTDAWKVAMAQSHEAVAKAERRLQNSEQQA